MNNEAYSALKNDIDTVVDRLLERPEVKQLNIKKDSLVSTAMEIILSKPEVHRVKPDFAWRGSLQKAILRAILQEYHHKEELSLEALPEDTLVAENEELESAFRAIASETLASALLDFSAERQIGRVIYLHIVAGLEWDEVAKVVGLTHSLVRSRYGTGIRRLRSTRAIRYLASE